MKVIGAGFGRTGTESMKVALERLLGGRCYHMIEVIARPDHLKRWHGFARSGRAGMDWKTLFEDYEAGVDWPVCNYYRELMEVFPDARVVLTVRDPETWFDSFTVLVRINDIYAKLGMVIPMFRRFTTMTDKAVWHIFGDRRDRHDRSRCVEVFKRHIEEVRAHVPPERLLVFDVREGWEPLCAFLGAAVPDEPFPHVNSRQDIERFFKKHVAIEVLKALSVAVLIAAALGAGAYLLF